MLWHLTHSENPGREACAIWQSDSRHSMPSLVVRSGSVSRTWMMSRNRDSSPHHDTAKTAVTRNPHQAFYFLRGLIWNFGFPNPRDLKLQQYGTCGLKLQKHCRPTVQKFRSNSVAKHCRFIVQKLRSENARSKRSGYSMLHMKK